MAKKSKKSSKSSSRSSRDVSTQQPSSQAEIGSNSATGASSSLSTTPRQLNPFYIEPAPNQNHSATWKGDYDWKNRNDDYYEEDEYEDEYTEQAQGLLYGNNDTDNQYHRSSSNNNSSNRGHRNSHGDDGSWKIRACALCMILPLLVGIVWNALSSSSDVNHNSKHSYNNSSSSHHEINTPTKNASHKRPTTAPTLVPIASTSKRRTSRPSVAFRSKEISKDSERQKSKNPVSVPLSAKTTSPTIPRKSRRPSQPPKRSRKPTTSAPVDVAVPVTPPAVSRPTSPNVETSADDDDEKDDDSTAQNDDDAPDTGADTDKQQPKHTATTSAPTNMNEKSKSASANADATVVPKTIVVLGERHSGVEWLIATMATCYPSLHVSSGFAGIRPAYWFQYDSPNAANRQRSRSVKEKPNKQDGSSAAVVVVMVRNPYDWVQDMWLRPLYAPAHYNVDKQLPTIRKFLAKPWSLDADATENKDTSHSTDRSTKSCQLGFTAQQVTPCLTATNMNTTNLERESTVPVYELDADGNVFKNVMAMRAAKIRYWVDDIGVATSTAAAKNGAVLVQFESGLTDDVLDALDTLTEQKSTCRTTDKKLPTLGADPQQGVFGDGTVNTTALIEQINVPKFKKWMLEHTNWREEGRIGYYPAAT